MTKRPLTIQLANWLKDYALTRIAVWFSIMSVVVLVTAYSLVGLVAIWGALGRGHWFLRIAAVLFFLAPWLAAPDYRFWVAFFVQSTVALVALLGIRGLRTSADSMQPTFSLKDLFLLMLAAGAALAMLARTWPSMRSQLPSAVVPGLLFALFTLMAAWAAEGARGVGLRLAMLTVFFPASLMGAWLWLARTARGRIGRVAMIAWVLLIAAPPAAFYYWLVWPQFVAFPEPPADNGMDDLLRAAEMVATPGVDIDALSGEALKAYLERHRPALKLARAALARPCQMTLPVDGVECNLAWMDQPERLKRLARVFVAEGRLHLEADQPREAASCFFEAMEFGEAMTRGGSTNDALLGMACQSAGLEKLVQLFPDPDHALCEELGLWLSELDERQATFDQIADRDWLWFEKSTPWEHRWRLLQLRGMWERTLQASATTFNRSLARRRLFCGHLALRRFRWAEGDYPKTLNELVPRFLKSLPPDPFSGGSLIYRRLPQGYLLYSVGEDGVDDGGKPLLPGSGSHPATGDMTFDVPLSVHEGVPQRARR